MNLDFNRKTDKTNRTILYISAFLIPAIMMFFVMIVLGVYPFGSRSILVSDLEIQFVDYFSYFKTILAGKNDFIYTFSKNLGGDMVGFSAYYLQNPLLLLLLFFTETNLPTGIMLMIILQIALSGLNFSVLINHLYDAKYSSLLFSTAYAFIGFFFAYISLPIYFTNLALLPIVILGIHKIVQNPGKWKLYTFSLALYVFFNYYLGFMMCIFSVLYFTFLILSKTDNIQEIKKYRKQIKVYILSSLASVLLIAFDLAMTVFSLQGQKDGLSSENLAFYRQFNILDLFAKLYSGSDKNHELPIIYCSVLAVVFLIFYYMCKKYSKREKILSAGFLLIMILCFNIHTLNVVWHGFNDPVGFAYRYAYFFSLLILLFAYRGFYGMDELPDKKQIWTVAGIFLFYSVYLFVRKNGYVGGKDIVINGFIICGVLGFYYLFKYNGKKGQHTLAVICLFLLGMVQILDLTTNAIRAIRFYPVNEMSKYTNEIQSVSEVIDEIKSRDTEFYRLEKDFDRSVNDSMQYNYAGLSHSSSCEKDYVKEFIGKMGFRNNDLWAYYHNGSTTFADCFLGVKYFISRFDSTEKPYTQLFSKNQYFAYENPYALPIAFCVSNNMKSVSMKTSDLFELQNAIEKAFDGGKEDLYTKIEPKQINTVNLKEEIINGIRKYTKQDMEQEAYIEYKVMVPDKNLLYLYFDAPHTQSAELLINDATRDNYFTNTDWSIINAGRFQDKEEVRIKLRLNEDSLEITNAYFYQEKEDILEKWYQNNSAGAASLQKLSSSHLTGTVCVPEGQELIMFSIPCEDGWKIKIDGKPVKQIEVLDALMAVDVTVGNHTIDMKYIPKGFYPTIWISIITAVILMFIMINGKIKSNGQKGLKGKTL